MIRRALSLDPPICGYCVAQTGRTGYAGQARARRAAPGEAGVATPLVVLTVMGLVTLAAVGVLAKAATTATTVMADTTSQLGVGHQAYYPDQNVGRRSGQAPTAVIAGQQNQSPPPDSEGATVSAPEAPDGPDEVGPAPMDTAPTPDDRVGADATAGSGT